MDRLPTTKIEKDGKVAVVNTGDLPAWEANGWKAPAPAPAAPPEPPPEAPEEPEAPKGKPKGKPKG